MEKIYNDFTFFDNHIKLPKRGVKIHIDGLINQFWDHCEKQVGDILLSLSNVKSDIINRPFITDRHRITAKNELRNSHRFDNYEIIDDYVMFKEFQPFTAEFHTTGKLIIENSLYDYYVNEFSSHQNIESDIKQMEYYLTQNVIRGYVGNNCPKILRCNITGSIQIGAEFDDSMNDIIPENYTVVGNIITDGCDCWITDYDTFVKNNPSIDTSKFLVVDVPCGTYELTHYYGIVSRDPPYMKLTRKK